MTKKTAVKSYMFKMQLCDLLSTPFILLSKQVNEKLRKKKERNYFVHRTQMRTDRQRQGWRDDCIREVYQGV